MTRRGFLGSAGLLMAQQEPVLRVDVKLVRFLATVKNADGQLVGGLDKADFTLTDCGVPQEIAVFERQTELPLSIALLIDTSGSTAKDLKYEIESASRFLTALTREGNPKDALALYSFNHEVEQHSGYTRNTARIRKALTSLKAEAGTSLYDALTLVAEPLGERPGRRVIVVVTDGGDTTSYRNFHDALKSVHRAEASIYSLVVVPITNDAGRNIGGENALITLGRSTGGRVFFPSVGAALDKALDDILRDLRTQYLLAYYPKGLPASPPAFHPVKITAKGTDLRVYSRDGYYGG
ncbi:MAG: VWA domain-containing protein [Bryobacteraceae bacterium]